VEWTLYQSGAFSRKTVCRIWAVGTPASRAWKSDTNSASTRGLKVLSDKNWDVEQAAAQSAAYRVRNVAQGSNPGFVNTLVSNGKTKREKRKGGRKE
jgi:hypothetical protein